MKARLRNVHRIMREFGGQYGSALFRAFRVKFPAKFTHHLAGTEEFPIRGSNLIPHRPKSGIEQVQQVGLYQHTPGLAHLD